MWVVGALKKGVAQEGGMVIVVHSGDRGEQRETGARRARELSGAAIQVKGAGIGWESGELRGCTLGGQGLHSWW